VRIDYTKTNFRLFAGDSLEITEYVDSIKIGIPDPEPGQILTWQGQIEISYNLPAIRSGVAEAEFDEWQRPLRWRPDRLMALILIAENGENTLIPLRIQRYAYSRQKRMGVANVHQIIDALAIDRPAEMAEYQLDRVDGGAELTDVIGSLIDLAYKVVSLPTPAIDLSKIWGKFEDTIATRNPLNDAADLGAACWTFMRLDPLERIQFMSLDTLMQPILFRRSDREMELDPEMNGFADWRSKAIVTGHYQHAAIPDCENTDQKENLDEQDRPMILQTISEAAYATVYPGTGSTSTALTPSEKKTVLTQYGDSELSGLLSQIWGRVTGGLLTATVEAEAVNTPNPEVVVPEIPQIKKTDNTGSVGTITITSRPFGSIFPDVPAGPADLKTFYVASVELQTERKKAVFAPRGIASPASIGLLLDLVLVSREIIPEHSASTLTATEGSPIDPNDPNKGLRCLEPRPQLEPRSTMPDFKMETVPVRGECNIEPQGWEPLVKVPLIKDFGFIPSQAHANALACQVAAQHVRKGSPHTTTMPIPAEWIAAGCPPIFRFHCGAVEYEAIGLALEFSRDRRSLSFDALRLGAAPLVPVPADPPLYIPGSPQIVSPVGSIVGFGGDAGRSIQLVIAQ
jgi:hypothetical protein